MCLMLYLATAEEQPLQADPDLQVKDVDAARESVRQWFSLPMVRFVGAHTGCSCGFPSVSSAEPVGYFPGMLDRAEDRSADLRSVRALLALIDGHVTRTGAVELYAVWDGDQASAPKGMIHLRLDAVDVETFFLNEQFLYRVTRSAP